MSLNRRDFLKITTALGTTAFKSPSKALAQFDKIAKFHELNKKQENLIKKFQIKHKLNHTELSSVFGWVEEGMTSRQVEILIGFLRKKMDQEGIKKIRKEFKKGELTPENGFEIKYDFKLTTNGKDRIEYIKFEKDRRVYNQLVYNTKGTLENNKVIDSGGKIKSAIDEVVKFENDYLKAKGVNEKVLQKLSWLREQGIMLPPEYWHSDIEAEEDTGDFVIIKKNNQGGDGSPTVKTLIKEDEIVMYKDNTDKELFITKEENKIKLMFHFMDSDEKENMYVYNSGQLRRAIEEFFAGDK